jgi:hypothetical protein
MNAVTVTVTVAQVESALRGYLANLDYDMHKNLECGEETGEDTYSDEAEELFGLLQVETAFGIEPSETSAFFDTYRDKVREATIQYAREVINRILKGPTYELDTLDAVDVQLAALADDASQPGVWAG